MCQKEMETIWN